MLKILACFFSFFVFTGSAHAAFVSGKVICGETDVTVQSMGIYQAISSDDIRFEKISVPRCSQGRSTACFLSFFINEYCDGLDSVTFGNNKACCIKK